MKKVLIILIGCFTASFMFADSKLFFGYDKVKFGSNAEEVKKIYDRGKVLKAFPAQDDKPDEDGKYTEKDFRSLKSVTYLDTEFKCANEHECYEQRAMQDLIINRKFMFFDKKLYAVLLTIHGYDQDDLKTKLQDIANLLGEKYGAYQFDKKAGLYKWGDSKNFLVVLYYLNSNDINTSMELLNNGWNGGVLAQIVYLDLKNFYKCLDWNKKLKNSNLEKKGF